MTNYIIAESEIKLLGSLCGATNLQLYTPSISLQWNNHVVVPVVSIILNDGNWIIVQSELGYESIDNHGYEVQYITINKQEYPGFPRSSKNENETRDTNNSTNTIGFSHKNELVSISIINYSVEIVEGTSVVFDGSLIFSFNDRKEFYLSAYMAPGGLLEFSRLVEDIDSINEGGIVRKVITKEL